MIDYNGLFLATIKKSFMMKFRLFNKDKVKKKEKVKKSPVREWFDAILFAVIAATIIRWLFLEAFTIPTASMEIPLPFGIMFSIAVILFIVYYNLAY